MFERVIVPLDGSVASRQVLVQLHSVLRRAVREVILLRVVPTVGTGLDDYPGVILGDDYRVAEARARDELAAEVATLTDAGLTVRSEVLRGPVAPTLIDAADAMRATMIAMATHGRSGPARWALGSVTEKVLRASPLPMLVVRSFRDGDEADLPNGDELFPRHILLPIDGSERSLDVAPTVHRLARGADPALTVVHFASDYAGERGMRDGARYLAEARSAFGMLGMRVRTELLRGDPAAGVVGHGALNVTGEPPIDFIAMSSHGRSGLARWVLGSVTEKVLRHAAVPMLVSRASLAVAPEHVRAAAASA